MKPIITKKLFTAFLILFLIASPFNFTGIFNTCFSQVHDFQGIVIDNPDGTTWTEDQIIEENILILSDFRLTIEKGVKITFKENIRVLVEGELIIDGTAKNPIKFRGEADSAKYSVIALNGGVIKARNADISGGGSKFNAYLVDDHINNRKFLNIANAITIYTGALAVDGRGILEAENCAFHDNEVAISVTGGLNVFDNKIKINRSKFHNNEYFDVHSISSRSIDLRYNWWGNANGPETYLDYFGNSKFKKIIGNVSVEPWATEENFHDPVIIVPGILGSWKWTSGGDWKLDPIFKTFDKLHDTFDENGYTPDEDLFTFPYNWRGSNAYGAQLLKNKIQEIKQETNWPKVDIIAHSMGGLLTREYIESDYYQDDIDQLITLGTPHNGAPKDYLTWEGGELEMGRWSSVFEKIFRLEAYENGFESIFDYVQNLPMKSIQELLPTYDYLKDAETEEMKQYPDDYPRNEFLENLNLPENISKLNDLEIINIIGKTTTQSTIERIRIKETPESKKPLWPHGYPENYGSIFSSDHGLELGEGDETVPLFSAKGIETDELIETEFVHGSLPSKTANTAFEYITGNTVSQNSGEMFVPIKNILFIGVFSPIDIQVFYADQDGVERKIGNGIASQTEDGAAYFKYHLENENGQEIGEEIEFLTIPNPQDGEYRILTQGIDSGAYRIEATKIAEDETTGEVTESTAVMEGIAELDKTGELKVEIKDSEVINKNQDTVSPTVTITSPENKKYLNNQFLEIEFEVEDNVSIPENIETKIYLDKSTYSSTYSSTYFRLDLALQNLGEHKIKITARDEAENENEETIIFQTTTSLNALIGNIKHYYELGLIKNQKTEKILIKAVEKLEKSEKLIQKIQNNKKMNQKTKDKIIKNIQKKTNRHIDKIIEYINHKSGKLINSKAKELLVESLEFLKY